MSFKIACSAMQEISLLPRSRPQTSSNALNTSCSAVLYDHVTKTDSFKIQHIYIEGSDRLYRSPGAAQVSDFFPYMSKLCV